MMDLRHIENVVLDKAVLHVLDTQMDEPILAQQLLDLDREDVHEFITKHALKALTDEGAFKAKFMPGTAMIERSMRLLDEDDFLEASYELALRLFNMIKETKEPSCDLLVIKFHTGNISAYGLMKLDFQKSYIHEIEFNESSFNVNIVAQEIALPSQQQKVMQCAFGVPVSDDNEYDLIVLNKKRSSDEEEKIRFVKIFLNATREFDYKDKTKTLKKTIEDWAQKNLKEDFDTASELRKSVDDKLRYHALVSAEDLAKEALAHDTNARHSLITKLEQQGIASDEKFEIDKRFVDKKMKSKTIRTDTGFVIRGDFELFEDDGFIEVQRNGDGTVNYIIKGVRHTKEK
ncbi:MULTISPECIES: nucleoid-associated protein [unclassified Fusibacter]|uniref:nucleoid-associated protein n=1 Tax=unclassified Fusibacter TaxID=2624464 RepID=UPI0013E91E42|nr:MULTISPECIES: nucleoid-associated protein [unclassified Fusibacter]MCK8061025.1 nucleoid-associated protein [Fusibacter sp. A2]NPE20521.1 nucleoid-associated protein [Fusibacter sp. A1]